MRSIKNYITVFLLLYSIRLSAQEQILPLVDSLSILNIKGHIEQLVWADGHESRSSFTDGNYIAAEYIAEYFESLPGVDEVIRDTFYIPSAASPYDTYPLYNVIAIIKGSLPEPDIILSGAHYDASGSREAGYDDNWQTMKARGADDNATGVAAIMEMARLLSDPSDSYEPLHTIKLISFAAEEYHPVEPDIHHAGSLYDAEKMYNSSAPLKGAVILDMIGFNVHYDFVEVIADDQSLWLANDAYYYRDFYAPGLITNDTPDDVPYSDHDSYQQYGFPAILFMENARPWNDDPPYYLHNPYYHTSLDLIGTLNFNLIEKVASLSLGLTGIMAIKEDPTGVEENFPVEDYIIAAAYPNPFNPATNIEIVLPEKENVTVEIYNVNW